MSMDSKGFDETVTGALDTYEEPHARVGFFTDTTLCIGCKACEVACKEWNEIPADGMTFTAQSYDNTSQLSGNTWRHVAFIEQLAAASDVDTATHDIPVQFDETSGRWLMESDVCKHCTSAACLDVCPTGALFHTEYGTVVVQEDVCNGCGYCIPACPFGVIGEQKQTGHVGKCTLCYDRLKIDETPACAKACPTQSIQFGEVAELRERAAERLERVRHDFTHVQLYGNDPNDGVGGFGAFFLLLDKPEVYGLPPDPLVTTRHLPQMWQTCGLAALALGSLVVVSAFAGKR
jgi:formate dehydrogenase iron-sulfur subunit